MTAGPTFEPARGPEAMAAASEAGGGGNFRKTFYLRLEKPGDSQRLRFVTEFSQMPTMRCHNGVPTKAAPEGRNAASWKSSMGAICRYDPAFGGYYKDCYICDNALLDTWGKKIGVSSKTYAIACLRMQHNGTWIDMPRDVKIKGDGGVDQVIKERSLVVVGQGQKNFWDHLRVAGMRNGTLSDRDVTITRQNTGTDTNYVPYFEDRDPELHPGSPSWQLYLTAMADQGLDLNQVIMHQASDEWYATFFDPRFTVDKDGNIHPVTASAFAVPAMRGAPPATGMPQMSLDAKMAMLASGGVPSQGADPWASTPATVMAAAEATLGDNNPWGDTVPSF